MVLGVYSIMGILGRLKIGVKSNFFRFIRLQWIYSKIVCGFIWVVFYSVGGYIQNGSNKLIK
jgi:hypothetical protein